MGFYERGQLDLSERDFAWGMGSSKLVSLAEGIVIAGKALQNGHLGCQKVERDSF